jgi:hypothetical protein
MLFTTSVSALCRHVALVVSRGTEEQVTRTDTSGSVAAMADEQTRWDGAVCLFPSPTMDEERDIPTVFAPRDSPVPSRRDRSCPEPTRIGLCHAGPDALGNRNGDSSHVARPRAIEALPASLVTLARELSAAVETGILRGHWTLRSSDVTPQGVRAPLGHFCASIVPSFAHARGT